MKILILSDTHGETSAAEEVLRSEKPDYVIHLGDCVRDAENLDRRYPYLPICRVAGNNDWFCDDAKEKVISLAETPIFLCHGHTTGVKSGLLVQTAKSLQSGAKVSLFGHTHSPFLEERDGLLMLNPGSLTYSGTYAILTLLPDGKPRAEIKYNR